MPWFKVDDSFYDHPKVFDAPDCAVALWVRAGSWSARNLRDGFVPTNLPARLCDDHDTAVRELIDRGLWRRTKGGYRFHQWDADGDGTPRNPTRSEAMAARSKQSSGGAIGNHRRWHEKKGVIDPDCRFCQQEQSSGTRSDTDRPPDTGGESEPNPPVPSPSPKGSTYVGIRRSGSQRAGARASPAELDHDAHTAAAHRIVERYAANCQRRPPASVLSKLARHVDELLTEDWPEQLVDQAIATWSTKQLGPSVLPSIANDLANHALGRGGTNGKPTKDDKLRALQRLKSQPLQAIEGGNAS